MKHTLSSAVSSWTNVQSPEPKELAEFIRDANLLTADAEFITQTNHRPSISARPDYLLLLIQVPVFDRKLRLTSGVALFLIITTNHIYSLHYQPLVLLDKIRMEFTADQTKLNEYFTNDSLGSCLDLITLLYDSAFRKLDRLAKHIEIAEDAVFQGNERKMVEEISLLGRDVMDFRKVIRPQKTLFAVAPDHKLVSSEAAIKWNRVHCQLLKMWEILESMSESVRELSHTDFVLIQHKQNELLRILTIYSIIVIPILSLVGPIFNPGSPGSDATDTIVSWIVLGLLLLILAVILLHSRRKRLL